MEKLLVIKLWQNNILPRVRAGRGADDLGAGGGRQGGDGSVWAGAQSSDEWDPGWPGAAGEQRESQQTALTWTVMRS